MRWSGNTNMFVTNIIQTFGQGNCIAPRYLVSSSFIMQAATPVFLHASIGFTSGRSLVFRPFFRRRSEFRFPSAQNCRLPSYIFRFLFVIVSQRSHLLVSTSLLLASSYRLLIHGIVLCESYAFVNRTDMVYCRVKIQVESGMCTVKRKIYIIMNRRKTTKEDWKGENRSKSLIYSH